MSAILTTAVVLDPMGELAGDVGRVEDWLGFAEPGSPEVEIAVAAGATAAGAVSLALVAAVGRPPACTRRTATSSWHPSPSSPSRFELVWQRYTGLCSRCPTPGPRPARTAPSKP